MTKINKCPPSAEDRHEGEWGAKVPDPFAPATDADLRKNISDAHSANHNRVNGIARLIDDWSDLFGVQPGDKLYVKPENRVKIW